MPRKRQEPKGAVKTSLFAHLDREEHINRLGDTLQEIDQLIDFKALSQSLEPLVGRVESPKGGRPAYPTELMLRIVVLKHLYGLSDEQTEYQLLDRLSFQRFTGLRNARNVPDRTTIWLFHERLGEEGSRTLFDEIKRQISAQGFIARGGQMIDASLVQAPKQRFSKEEKALLEKGEVPQQWRPAKGAQKDIEATWTKKHGKSYFGYKLHVGADARGKFIRTVSVTTASESDTRHMESVLDSANTSKDLYADRGYVDGAREERLIEEGFRPNIQRKAQVNKPLSATQKGRNERIAKTRARIEHVFGAMHWMGAHYIRTIGLPRAKTQLTLKSAVYNIRRLVSVQRVGLEAF